MQDRYEAERLEQVRSRARVLALIGVAFFPAFSILDYVVERPNLAVLIAVRLAVAAILAIGAAFLRTDIGRTRPVAIAAAGFAAAAAGVSLICYLGEGPSDPHHAGINLVVIAMGLVLPLRLREGLLICGLIWLISLVPTLAMWNPNFLVPFITNSFFMVGSTTLALAGLYFQRRWQGREFAARLSLEERTAERAQAEEALRESTEQYQSLYNNAQVGLLRARISDGKVLECNDLLVRMHGYASHEEFIAEYVAFEHYVDPGTRERMREEYAAKGEIKNFEARVSRRDGSVFWERMSGHIFPDRGYIEAVVADITEEKNAEATRLQLSTAIEQSAEIIVITDTDGIVQYVNPAFERITGYVREEVIGRHAPIGDDASPFHGGMRDTVTSGQTWHGQVTSKKKDGTHCELEVSISPVKDATGRVVNYVAVARDVTEHIKLETQLRQAQKMDAIGGLAGGIAHDFNNLLTSILGNVEMLKMDLDPKSLLHEYADEIAYTAACGAELTKRLLTFSRKAIIKPQSVSLNTLMKDITQTLQHVIGEDITMTIVPGSGLWSVTIDPDQVEQIMLTLASNGRDAMPDGGKLLIETHNVILDDSYVGHHAGVLPGKYVMLAVSDSGHGMDEEVRSHLFEPFFTTKETAAGLGLATAYSIVKQNNGHIWCYSEPGQGTTFKIYLPADESATDAEHVRGRARESLHGTETILIVEDEQSILTVSVNLLRGQGYTVLQATSGEEALKISEKHPGPIHLLLTDVILPGMSGRELAERLASAYPSMRVLYTSGYTANLIEHHGVLEPGIAFIQKPYHVIDLLLKVRWVLDGEAG